MRFTRERGDRRRDLTESGTRVRASHRRRAVTSERLRDRKPGVAFDRGDGRVAQDVRGHWRPFPCLSG